MPVLSGLPFGEPICPRQEQIMRERVRLVLHSEVSRGYKDRLEEGTHVVVRPLDFIGKHPVHGRDDLHGHVDQALAEDEANVICTPEAFGTQQCLQRLVQLGIGG